MDWKKVAVWVAIILLAVFAFRAMRGGSVGGS